MLFGIRFARANTVPIHVLFYFIFGIPFASATTMPNPNGTRFARAENPYNIVSFPYASFMPNSIGTGFARAD